ncbi:hypothetical protein [Caballeronia cordobensis]|uniref:hypothetical protein n=1 Tax=Caballeronia cordobensis TaxID=1353886 RepID=UPI00045F0BA0|nr:putative membrane protein [Burkholderia sp. RPE67]BBP96281.1 hypothetical protein BSFA1_14100 [Burkholderia sp. SFA1]
MKGANLPTAERVLGSYLLSVTVGVGFLVSVFEVTSLATGQGVIQAIVFTVMAFAISWLTGVTTAALPCALLALVARLFAVRSLLFYLIAGVAIGLLLVPVFDSILNSVSWYADPPEKTDVTMVQGMKQVGASFAIAGGLAGLTFWRRAGRHYR